MLFKISNDGSVINEAHLNKVQPEYLSILKIINSYYKDVLKDNLVGIYIRGSVSVGRAKPYISDIDSVAITHRNVTKKVLREAFLFMVHLLVEFANASTVLHAFEKCASMRISNSKRRWGHVLKNNGCCLVVCAHVLLGAFDTPCAQSI